MKIDPLINQILIKLLKFKRLSLNLSQSDLAKSLNTYQSFVSKYESNERILTFDEVWGILHVINVNPIDFIIELTLEVESLNESKPRI